MLIGAKYASGFTPVSHASTSSVSMPNLGGSSLPVRDRPPSMKNSCVNPSCRRRFTYAPIVAE